MTINNIDGVLDTKYDSTGNWISFTYNDRGPKSQMAGLTVVIERSKFHGSILNEVKGFEDSDYYQSVIDGLKSGFNKSNQEITDYKIVIKSVIEDDVDSSPYAFMRCAESLGVLYCLNKL